jgi:hypothetical protein
MEKMTNKKLQHRIQVQKENNHPEHKKNKGEKQLKTSNPQTNKTTKQNKIY